MKKLTKKDFTKNGFAYPFWGVLDSIQEKINGVDDGACVQIKQLKVILTEGAYELLNGTCDEIINASGWMFSENKYFTSKIEHIVAEKEDGKWFATFYFE